MFILSYIYSTIIILFCQINSKSRFWEFYTVWMHLCLSLRKFNCFVQIRRHIHWKKHKERKIEQKGYLLSYHLNHYFCNRRRHIDAGVRHKPNRGKSIELQLDNKPCLDIVFISRNSICRRADHFNINPCESVCKTRCFFVFRRHMDKSLCLGQFHHLMQISVSFRPQNQKKKPLSQTDSILLITALLMFVTIGVIAVFGLRAWNCFRCPLFQIWKLIAAFGLKGWKTTY